jgi:transportin-1
MLTQAKASPDFDNYLAFLLSSSHPPSSINLSSNDFHGARLSAAIMLKNDIKNSYKSINKNHLSYIQSSVLNTLQDQNAQIRSFAGNVITEIVRQGTLMGWPELLPQLFLLAGNESGRVASETQEGAMNALFKICEDNKTILDQDYQGQRPLNFIVPKLLEFTASKQQRVRADALASLIIFIPQKPQAVLVILDKLLERLFQLTSDPSDNVRKYVCRTLANIAEVRPDKIVPHMAGLVDFVITQQRKMEDEELALDAAEFWLSVAEHTELRPTLEPFLPKIIPVLLETMVYSEDDILVLEGAAEDEDEEDRVEDIKPQFAKGKADKKLAKIGEESEANGMDQNKSSSTAAGTQEGSKRLDDDLSEGEIDEDVEDDGGDPEDQWNLRKCSAAALDTISSNFHNQVFQITLPYLMQNLQHQEWPNREAAVLALGAVAIGCMDAVTPHLPELIPYLLTQLNDEQPVVRKITCWTLGRYSGWAAHLEDPASKAQFFEPIMNGILLKMLDGNKKVQEAAASAFANLEERAMTRLVPYCEPIVRQFVRCFSKYKDRNMFILYDCVQTLAEQVGPALKQEELVNLLMPALIQRWSAVSDQSRELFPLLECLSYIANALGKSFTTFAEPVFQRCLQLIHQNLEDYLAASKNPALDQPDKDFLVTSLDLLSAIIQAVDENVVYQLVRGAQPKFFQLLIFCMEDAGSEVRQSSFALAGDCAIYVTSELGHHLEAIMMTVIKQLNLDTITEEDIDAEFSVLNNACWACGELSVHFKEHIRPWAEEVYQRLIAILLDPSVPDTVNQNAAIALGRLGLGSSERLSVHLVQFASPFLETMERVEYTDEKDTAFQGFSLTISWNPTVMEPYLKTYFSEMAKYQNVFRARGFAGEHLQPIFQMVRS